MGGDLGARLLAACLERSNEAPTPLPRPRARVPWRIVAVALGIVALVVVAALIVGSQA